MNTWTELRFHLFNLSLSNLLYSYPMIKEVGDRPVRLRDGIGLSGTNTCTSWISKRRISIFLCTLSYRA